LTYNEQVNILVTGGSGFIGSHLCERLILDGHNVVALDDLSSGRKANLDDVIDNANFELRVGSILDRDLIGKVTANIDFIFHLAAAVGVFNIVNKPLESLLTNIRGTENIFEFADKRNIPVLFSSSSEIYGKNTIGSLKEDDDRILGTPTTLRWSYSEAKAIDESLAFAYFSEKKLPTRIVRFFNTVGPRQLGDYGMVLPRFIESALQNKTIQIYGTGQQTRCFAHVSDVIDALLKISFTEKTIGRVVNIGNNVEISINNLAELVIDITNSSSKIVHIPYNQAYGIGFEDMQRRVPDISLLESLVDWKPTHSIHEIILDIIKEKLRLKK
jgi:UDP-glucose 4-epimerase